MFVSAEPDIDSWFLLTSHAQKHFIKLKRQGRESLIPPRRNKDRREDENGRYVKNSSRISTGNYRKRNSFDAEEKYFYEARESKRRPNKRSKSVAPTSPGGDSVNSWESLQEEEKPKHISLDTNAGVQALLLLSQG